jgi:type IV fimbrial biogenesis protein FimT
LIEAMVAMVIMAGLLAMAMPSFTAWNQGARVRAQAESMLAGLQYAKSEAASRNGQVRFQLTTSIDATCARSVTGSSWVVDAVDADAATDSVEGKCDTLPSDTVAPSILQVRAGTETGTGTTVNADQSAVVFNGLGRLVPPPASVINIEIRTSDASRCATLGGPVTCLRVAISPGGQVRMCNPNLPSGEAAACE